jgi:hypothetical protein
LSVLIPDHARAANTLTASATGDAFARECRLPPGMTAHLKETPHEVALRDRVACNHRHGPHPLRRWLAAAIRQADQLT